MPHANAVPSLAGSAWLATWLPVSVRVSQVQRNRICYRLGRIATSCHWRHYLHRERNRHRSTRLRQPAGRRLGEMSNWTCVRRSTAEANRNDFASCQRWADVPSSWSSRSPDDCREPPVGTAAPSEDVTPQAEDLEAVEGSAVAGHRMLKSPLDDPRSDRCRDHHHIEAAREKQSNQDQGVNSVRRVTSAQVST